MTSDTGQIQLRCLPNLLWHSSMSPTHHTQICQPVCQQKVKVINRVTYTVPCKCSGRPIDSSPATPAAAAATTILSLMLPMSKLQYPRRTSLTPDPLTSSRTNQKTRRRDTEGSQALTTYPYLVVVTVYSTRQISSFSSSSAPVLPRFPGIADPPPQP